MGVCGYLGFLVFSDLSLGNDADFPTALIVVFLILYFGWHLTEPYQHLEDDHHKAILRYDRILFTRNVLSEYGIDYKERNSQVWEAETHDKPSDEIIEGIVNRVMSAKR